MVEVVALAAFQTRYGTSEVLNLKALRCVFAHESLGAGHQRVDDDLVDILDLLVTVDLIFSRVVEARGDDHYLNLTAVLVGVAALENLSRQSDSSCWLGLTRKLHVDQGIIGLLVGRIVKKLKEFALSAEGAQQTNLLGVEGVVLSRHRDLLFVVRELVSY